MGLEQGFLFEKYGGRKSLHRGFEQISGGHGAANLVQAPEMVLKTSQHDDHRHAFLHKPGIGLDRLRALPPAVP